MRGKNWPGLGHRLLGSRLARRPVPMNSCLSFRVVLKAVLTAKKRTGGPNMQSKDQPLHTACGRDAVL